MGILGTARAPVKALPPADVLRRLLAYDPTTGILTWKRQAGVGRQALAFNNKCAGKVAGTVAKNHNGKPAHIKVGISGADGKTRYYGAHRLIWKIVTGNDPAGVVDHEDLNGLNNRWGNLREASHGQNKANSRPTSASGFKGVHWCELHKKWRAIVRGAGKINHVGYFDDATDAAAARHAAAIRIQGEFARTF